MKIVLLESLGVSEEVLRPYVEKLEEKGHTFEAFAKSTDQDTLVQECEGADAAIIANMPFPDAVVERCKSLKFIDVAFTGVDHVGLAAAKKAGIKVSNASGYSTEAVAELALGMALSLFRNVPQVEDRCRTAGTKDGLVGRQIQGKTVGIVGYGTIGSRTAELFHYCGCDIIAYTPHPKDSAPDYVRFVTLEEVMAESDIVSLHCPQNASTIGMINEKMIGLMKKDAILINCARGPVVDYTALAKALNQREIGGAGIDVFEKEPPIPEDHPLFSTPNTLVTPHVAFATKESMQLRAQIVFDNLDKWMAGGQINVIL